MWRQLLVALVLVALTAGHASAQQLSVFGPSGGPGGTQFTDGVIGGDWPTELLIRSGWYIDAVQIVYKSKQTNAMRTGPRHGGTGGTLKAFKLNDGEYIVKIGGTYDKYVTSLWVFTNQGRQMEWGDKSRGRADYFYSAPSGSMIYQFWGRSGTFVDAIGVEISPVL